MEFYISWCIVEFVLCLISLISKLIEKHSQMSRNFEKIWFYYRLSSGKYELKKQTKWKEFLSVIWNIFLNVIFSRISVTIFIYSWIKSLIEKSRLPDKMKEINFKLKHKNLDKDEMLSLWNEGNEYLWYDERSYYYKLDDEVAEYKDWVLTWWYELDLWDRGWIESAQVSPNINRIFWLEWGRGRAFEYRITWTKLLVKCMQYDVKNWTEYAIKNWKINETTLKTWYAAGNHNETEEEYINSFRELCDRHVLKNIRVTTFVLYVEQDIKKESEKMGKEKFNSLIDSKISDLEKCEKEIKELLGKYKSLKDVEDWDKLNKTQKKEQEEYRKEFEKIEEKYWCSHFEEGEEKEKIIEELNSYKM